MLVEHSQFPLPHQVRANNLLLMISVQTLKDLHAIRVRKNNRGPYLWEEFMKKYDCQVICELGVCNGVNLSQMIKHKPKIAIAIDSWIEDGKISRNHGRATQSELDKQYSDFKKSVTDKSFIQIYREYTFDAVKHFKNNYFDVVYVDADHSYEACLRDIIDWYPKVKKGRFLFGDDYRVYEGRRRGISFGVIEAVNEFVKRNNLEFYELPSYGWVIIKK